MMMQNEARETILILTGCNPATLAEQPAQSIAPLGSDKEGGQGEKAGPDHR